MIQGSIANLMSTRAGTGWRFVSFKLYFFGPVFIFEVSPLRGRKVIVIDLKDLLKAILVDYCAKVNLVCLRLGSVFLWIGMIVLFVYIAGFAGSGQLALGVSLSQKLQLLFH